MSAGITLDITTGNLLSPAIEFTYRNTTYWNDTFNNQIYWSPEEVTVLPVEAKENLPIARVFHNPKELANEWKYERLQGTWLGGEFGHSKAILDLYKRFFTKNQAVAITQKPTVLYRIRLENLRLNRYARAAVDTLTHTFNEELYTDFINSWGTHIVQQALIGNFVFFSLRFIRIQISINFYFSFSQLQVVCVNNKLHLKIVFFHTIVQLHLQI